MLLQFHARTRFRTSMRSGIWCLVFIQVQVSGNHAVRKWTFDFLKKKQTSDNHAVGNWTFWSGNNRIVLSQADVCDNHAVRNLKPSFFSSHNFWPSCSQVGFCNNHISLRFLGTRDICLPWVVGLQGDRHLYRLIQAASTGVNLLLWRHLGTKAKERPAAMFFPHQRSPYVTRSTTAICGEF